MPSVSQAGSNEMIAIDVEQNTRGFDEVPSEVVLRGQGVVRLKAGREVLFGRLTATGKAQLLREQDRWSQLVDAIGRVMKPAE